MNVKILGLVDNYTSADFGPMSKHRAIASTSFLGRYAFVDFPLSNFTNSGIESMGILCKNHIRSLSRHVTNGRVWTSNTKIGDFSILYDEPNVRIPAYNTDVANLIENHWFLNGVKPDYVVIAPSHIIYQADFRQLVEEHIASKNKITLLYSHQTGLKNHFINADKVTLGDRGRVMALDTNKGNSDEGDISLATWIMSYDTLLSLVEFGRNTSAFFNLTDVLKYTSTSVLVRGKKIDGYVRQFDSLAHYLQYSLELLDQDIFSELFKPEWPIFTRSYDTPPVLYRNGCKVENSYIANGSIIEGTVINSIIGRDVRIKKGSVIKNAVIGSNAVIDQNTRIENAVVDKEAQVMHINEVIGSLEDPLYVARGDVV